MRQLVLDTETTGLSPEAGHRIIEIGAVELIDRNFTGKNFHQYINPERSIEEEALAVHGITNKFLADKPTFAQVMQDFIAYVAEAELIIHNAPFDVGFLNYEFRLIDKKAKLINKVAASVFDTLDFARKKHPGKKNSLDALCKRYNIDNSKREFHGALLDAQLLAEVYLIMTGGQMNLFEKNDVGANLVNDNVDAIISNDFNLPIIHATSEELSQHHDYLQKLAKRAGKSLWSENSDKEE